MNVIGLIHDSRHVGFQIVMQISHVLCGGGKTLETRQIAGKLAGRNIVIRNIVICNKYI